MTLRNVGGALILLTLAMMLRCLHDLHVRAEVAPLLPRVAMVTLAAGAACLITAWAVG